MASIIDMDLCFTDMSEENAEKTPQRLMESGEDATEEILCFCVAPNGEEVVTASRNFLLRHWRLESRECVRSIKGHRMPVLSMAYDSSSTLVATGAADRIVRVWDIPRGYCTHSFKLHTDIVPLVMFHPDPLRLQLFSAAEDSTIKVYDLIESKCVGDFGEHLSQVTSISLTEDGYTLASVGRDKVLNFYDLRNMCHLKTSAVMEELEAVCILPDEKGFELLGEGSQSLESRKRKFRSTGTHVIITGGERGVLRFFKFSIKAHDKQSFQIEPLLQVNAANGSISASDIEKSHFGLKTIDFLPKSSDLVVTTADNAVIYFNINQNVKRRHQLMGSFDEILDMAILREGGGEDNQDEATPYRIAVVSNSPQVQILDSLSRTENLLGHEDVVLSVDASPDGQWLVTSSKDKTCRVWSTSSLECVAVAEGHSDAVGCVAISQRLSTYSSKLAVFVSGGGDKVLKKWSLSALLRSPTHCVKLTASCSVRAHDKDITTLAMAPNDSMAASGSQDCKIRLWRADDLTPLATLSGHKRSVWRVCFSPVDKCLASCSGDRTVKLWSLADHSCLRTFQGHSASVLCVKFVSSGMQLVSGASDGLINLWTIRSGELQNTFDQHQDKVWTLEVAVGTSTREDSGEFLSGGSDSRLVVWADCSVQEERGRLQALEEKMLLDQQLGNDIRLKRYHQALRSALQLKYPSKLLEIFRCILEDFEMKLLHNEDSKKLLGGIESVLEEYVLDWSAEDVTQVLTYVKEWNSNSRNSYLVNLLLASVFRVVGIDELSDMPGLSDLLAGISAYSDRHYQRLNRLHEATYLMEFINSEMSILSEATEL